MVNLTTSAGDGRPVQKREASEMSRSLSKACSNKTAQSRSTFSPRSFNALTSSIKVKMAAAPAPMAASTANWHWKNKNVTRWSKEWFERELVTISVTDDKGLVVSISDVTDVAGDVELGQRKSKCVSSS